MCCLPVYCPKLKRKREKRNEKNARRGEKAGLAFVWAQSLQQNKIKKESTRSEKKVETLAVEGISSILRRGESHQPKWI